MQDSPLAAPCQQLIQISQDVFELGAYDAAYHALVAALDCAKDLEDFECLFEIVGQAESQLAYIDQHQPGHRLSTASAARQGYSGLLQLLVHRARLEANQLQSAVENRYLIANLKRAQGGNHK